jgi:hypothetical protein
MVKKRLDYVTGIISFLPSFVEVYRENSQERKRVWPLQNSNARHTFNATELYPSASKPVPTVI